MNDLARAVADEGTATLDVARRAWRHARSEFLSDLDAVMATVDTGRTELLYALTSSRSGGGRVEAATRPEGVIAHYDSVYGAYEVQDWRTLTELGARWYVFFNGIVQMRDRKNGAILENESIVFFPMGEDGGIHGEMAWTRDPESERFDEALPVTVRAGSAVAASLRRRRMLDLHEAYVAALAANNLDAVVASYSDTPNLAMRDYCGEPGAQFSVCDGQAALRDHYRRLLERFEIVAVDTIQRTIGDWYIFAELRWQVRDRYAGGRALLFHSAAFAPVVGAGVVAARYGFGTDPVPA